MELTVFIQNFASQFDDTAEMMFVAETKFREIPEWSSLLALSIMAMVDEEYNVQLKGGDMRNAQTIEDLFNIVKSKI